MPEEAQAERQYLCIDLKSFYASVECSERGRDPLKTNLVVADPERQRKPAMRVIRQRLPSMRKTRLPTRSLPLRSHNRDSSTCGINFQMC